MPEDERVDRPTVPAETVVRATVDGARRCFVISPIGGSGTETRRRADQVLKYVIEAVLKPRGFTVVRADRMSDAGLINSQILDEIVKDELVVADLTDANPNVFYELAVRHALGKPFVQLCQSGQDLPFDVQGQRTIFFDYKDLDSVDHAKIELENSVAALEGVDKVETPLTVTVDLLSLRSSGDPDKQVEAQMLDFMQLIDRKLSRLGALAPRTGVHRADYDQIKAAYEANVDLLAPWEIYGLKTKATSPSHNRWVDELASRAIRREPTPVAVEDPRADPKARIWSDEPPF